MENGHTYIDKISRLKDFNKRATILLQMKIGYSLLLQIPHIHLHLMQTIQVSISTHKIRRGAGIYQEIQSIEIWI